MKRDGTLESLWQSEITVYGHENDVDNTDIDVVIVGAGITGVTCALNLQKKGFDCMIIEAAHMGYGTTSGTTAHLNNFFDASYDVVITDFGLDAAKLLAQAAGEALEIIHGNIVEFNIDCDYSTRTAYLFSVDGKQEKILDDLVEGSRKACPCHGSRFGINGEVLTGPAVKKLKNILAETDIN